MIDPMITAFAFAVGLTVGVVGIGGGSVGTPLLILLFGVRPMVAVGTDLAYMAVTKAVGAVQHQRQGTVDLTLMKHLAIAAAPSAVAGFLLVNMLNLNLGVGADFYMKKLLAATLLGALVMLGLQASLKKWRRSFNGVHLAPMHLGGKTFAYALGGATGFLMSLTSVGAGTFMLPFMMLLFPIAANRLVGTGIAVAAVISAVAAVGYLFMGALNLGLFLSFLLGSVPGVVLGSRLNYKTPTRILKVGLIAVLLVASLALALG